MKSTISEGPAPAEPTYPYFGIWPDKKLIILFIAPKTGTIVFDSETPERLGISGMHWAENEFKRWNGSVTISV